MVENAGLIYGINGPIVYVKGDVDFKMSEMVYVGEERLIGEVIGLSSKYATVQVYEETNGLKPGAKVASGKMVISSKQANWPSRP